MEHTEGGNRREEDRLPRLEGAEWQGLLSCLQWKGGKNRRQNLRFFVPHHSPYILHSNGAQTALSSGQVLGTRISSQVGDLPKGEDKITKRDKITCPDKMMAQCGTTLLSGLGGQTWQALVVPTVARKTVTIGLSRGVPDHRSRSFVGQNRRIWTGMRTGACRHLHRPVGV